MRFNNTDIFFNPDNGCICSITNTYDKNNMNWCSDNASWGNLRIANLYGKLEFNNLPLKLFREEDNYTYSEYYSQNLSVKVERFFNNNGIFTERYTLKNITDREYIIPHGNFGIELPLRDNYSFADDALVHCCNTHLWCADNVTYINALKMGDSKINLGIVLTKGAIASYSQSDTSSNNRGYFILDTEHLSLSPNEEYVIEWEMFWHEGTEDFNNILFNNYDILLIESKYYTVFENEKIEFTVKFKRDTDFTICLDGDCIPFEKKDNELNVVYAPKKLGKHRFEINYGEKKTYTEFFVCEKIDKIIEKRVEFIVNNQQFFKENSLLDGAYLIFDNKEKTIFNNEEFYDHNACRERIGMALLIAKYLQTNKNERVLDSLLKYVDFLKREFYDEKTGEVFNGIGRNNNFIRLYNSPWVAQFFAEMYILTNDNWYSENAFKAISFFYENGGDSFYPNAFDVSLLFSVLTQEKKEKFLFIFEKHINNLKKNGLSYPKHEVNYEQTIVAPAVTLLSQGSLLIDNISLNDIEIHLEPLKRFNGKQPSYHLNEIPIRYWDDFWFGKQRTFGDVFPHYWACLSATAFYDYYDVSGLTEYKELALKCIRNCLCLFNEKGEGSCAYVYPYRLCSVSGEFYDEFANDQDFALYYALKIFNRR